MRKLIAAMNMTLDGFCDHTAGIVNDETNGHYNDLLRNADTLIYGRKTYQLMEDYWPAIVKNPSGNKAEDEFAVLIDNIHKIVYSKTLRQVEWKNTTLKHDIIREEILALKEQEGKNILAGSPSLILALMHLDLVDEYQFCIHPVILGSGLPLFRNIEEKIDLTLLRTKTFDCGVLVLYYTRAKK